MSAGFISCCQLIGIGLARHPPPPHKHVGVTFIHSSQLHLNLEVIINYGSTFVTKGCFYQITITYQAQFLRSGSKLCSMGIQACPTGFLLGGLSVVVREDSSSASWYTLTAKDEPSAASWCKNECEFWGTAFFGNLVQQGILNSVFKASNVDITGFYSLASLGRRARCEAVVSERLANNQMEKVSLFVPEILNDWASRNVLVQIKHAGHALEFGNCALGVSRALAMFRT
jgi:hypothetical protein